MEENWRIVQLFLGKTLTLKDSLELHEVAMLVTNSDVLKCTCASYKRYDSCTHTTHVSKKIKNNNGIFSLQVPEDFSDEEALEALESETSSRNFMINYGKIEVI